MTGKEFSGINSLTALHVSILGVWPFIWPPFTEQLTFIDINLILHADKEITKVPEHGGPQETPSNVPAPTDTPYSNGDGERAGEEDTEENETCGFCIFMKGGGCKDSFMVSCSK